jgi:hypothetical protein
MPMQESNAVTQCENERTKSRLLVHDYSSILAPLLSVFPFLIMRVLHSAPFLHRYFSSSAILVSGMHNFKNNISSLLTLDEHLL